MKGKRLLGLLAILVVVIVLVIVFYFQSGGSNAALLEKANLMKAQVVTDETIQGLGNTPVKEVGNVVFLSVSDGSSRAEVFVGTGTALSDAWDSAAKLAARWLGDMEPLWVRADIVCQTWPATALSELEELEEVSAGFDFNGLAFDPGFKTAILEGELNGRGIYDYKDNKVDVDRLNKWMEERGKEPLKILPDDMTGFKCWSWFCDEDNIVYPLYREGADTGRRVLSGIDADYAKDIIDTASAYLLNQVKADGTFVYNVRPQRDTESDDYNILRHSGTIWSLICRYRIFPDDTLKEKIDSTIAYMLSQILYDGDGAAYIYEADDEGIKLGGNGIAIVALTEYMDVFETDVHTEVCKALGEGILKQQNSSGGYWHVLTPDFEKLEEFRTVYYDGECTFGLVRLYSLTGDQKWLDAACLAIDHFIKYDYTQYRDHWVAYSLNEVTKYVDKQEYYDFALANAVNNYEKIKGRYRTYPTNLELLISAFETWQRMVEKGIDTGDFEVKDFLDVISARANRQLSGYFYPELAMYMANPQRIVGSFMMRNDKFRVRIDDVQHNIGGFYLYWKNYDAMVAAGLDSSVTDTSEKTD